MSQISFAISRLQALRPEFERHGVVRAWLFGSRARGEVPDSSDWDLLVEFGRPPSFDDYMGLKVRLEDVLGSTVDILVRSACKPRFLTAIQGELRNVA
jgi:predicted nucleotidyltransferase